MNKKKKPLSSQSNVMLLQRLTLNLCLCRPLCLGSPFFSVEAVVEFDYEAQQDDELSLTVGDIIVNIRRDDGGWWEGELGGRRGLFPDNFVRVSNRDPPPQSNHPPQCLSISFLSYKPTGGPPVCHCSRVRFIAVVVPETHFIHFLLLGRSFLQRFEEGHIRKTSSHSRKICIFCWLHDQLHCVLIDYSAK